MRAFEIAQLKTTTFHTELHSEFKVVHFSPTQIQQNKKPQELNVFQVWTGEYELQKKAMRRNLFEVLLWKSLHLSFLASRPSNHFRYLTHTTSPAAVNKYPTICILWSISWWAYYLLEYSRWITSVLSKVHTMTSSISSLSMNPIDIAHQVKHP